MAEKPRIKHELRDLVQSETWPSNRAILFVHGVGNAAPGDYTDIVAKTKQAIGPSADQFAYYQLFYDEINDWAGEKTEVADKIVQGLEILGSKLDGSDLAQAMLETVGDVLWPVTSLSIRMAIRELYLAQVKQIVLDGYKAVATPLDMKISIVCHSLGCYHTYEMLHAAAKYKTHCLQPLTHGIQFQNVVFMASPVRLIRTVAKGLKGLVSAQWSATLDDVGLARPVQVDGVKRHHLVDNWISITGKLDPVGGHFLRKKADWAYMSVPGQKSFIDEQDWLNLGDDDTLADALRSALNETRAPDIGINNPHSWAAYIDRHREDLGTWFNA